MPKKTRLINFQTLAICFCLIFPTIFFTQDLFAASGNATTQVPDKFNHSLALTLYHNGALFQQNGTFELKKGFNDIVIWNICPDLLPSSIYLESPGARIESFSYQLRPISMTALLEAFLGKKVLLRSGEKKCCVKGSKKSATLVSFKNGKALVETDEGIFQIEISKILFPSLPSDLSSKPQIRLSLWSKGKGPVPIGLFYLSRRLDWTAEYTGMLGKNEDKIDVQAYAFLKNNSSYEIKDAVLKLVAGKVNFRSRQDFLPMRRTFEAKAMAAAPPEPVREQIFEYHMYKISRTVSLLPRQSKHVALFQVGRLPCMKKLILRANTSYYYRNLNRSVKRIHPDIVLEVDTSKGMVEQPFPAGMFRVYKKDSGGSSIFMGEQRIPETPSGEKIALNLGKAFDVTAAKKQTNFRRIKTGDKYSFRYDSSYEIEIHNAKDKPVSVIIEEELPGDWTITEENIPHRKENAHLALWQIKVEAKGRKLLKYSVRVWD